MRFDGQHALVVGAETPIGAAVAALLAARGAAVSAVSALGDEPGDAVVQRALADRQRIDVLIHAASSAPYAPLAQISDAQWLATLAANLDAPYALCRAAIRPMMRQRYGRIVLLAALHGVAGGPGQADFSAASGGVIGLVRSLAREAAPWAITVNAVAPGLIADGILDQIPADQKAWGEQVIALRRSGTPEEVAAAIVFLASPLASYITGQTLAVDGGWRMA